MEKSPIIQTYHHILIGLPASGKSTFVEILAKQIPHPCIISTDQIRTTLYNDPTIQGDWTDIETQALELAQTALKNNQTIIYDATNIRRVWRLNWLQKTQTLSPQPLHWVAWFLDIPAKECHKRNKKRDRQVPPQVIDSMAKDIRTFPPDESEGIIKIQRLTLADQKEEYNPTEIQRLLAQPSRSIIYRQNRCKKYTYHRYSHLLDFERLLFLLQLLLQKPNTQATEPPLQHIKATLSKNRGAIYADIDELQADLHWLDANGFFQCTVSNSPLTFPEPCPEKLLFLKKSHYPNHRYSDWQPFARLLSLIQGLSRHPFLGQKIEQTDATQSEVLIQDLVRHNITHWEHKDAVRRDIEKILKPYRFMPQKFPLKHGYFVGTAILSVTELKQLREVLHSQEIYLEDPAAIALLEVLDQRLAHGNIQRHPETHSIRAIGNRHKVDIELLPSFSLLKQQDRLATAIHSGEMLQFSWLQHSAQWETGDRDSFFAYPLQIVFFNSSWYLGYEKENGLFSFSRMDRLSLLHPDRHCHRSAIAQKKATSQLERLHKATFGVHLGKDPVAQRQYLSSDRKLRQQAEVQIEIWMNDRIFSFIREGTQRFQKRQMQFSMRGDRLPQTKAEKRLFCLKGTGDKMFPHRLRLALPHWSLQDIELKRWLIGFHSNIKIVEPSEFAAEFRTLAQNLASIYQDQ